MSCVIKKSKKDDVTDAAKHLLEVLEKYVKNMQEEITELKERCSSLEEEVNTQRTEQPKQEARRGRPPKIDASEPLENKISTQVMRRLAECGLVKKGDYEESSELLKGSVPAYEILRSYVSEESGKKGSKLSQEISNREVTLHSILKNEAPRYIRNIGDKEKPFYIMRKIYAERFDEFLRENLYKARKSRGKTKEPETGARKKGSPPKACEVPEKQLEDRILPSTPAMKRLVRSGLLKEADYEKASEILRGKISVYEKLRGHIAQRSGAKGNKLSLEISNREVTLNSILKREMPKYVSNIGTEENPFYVVGEKYAKQLEEFLEESLYAKRGVRKTAEPETGAKKRGRHPKTYPKPAENERSSPVEAEENTAPSGGLEIGTYKIGPKGEFQRIAEKETGETLEQKAEENPAEDTGVLGTEEPAKEYAKPETPPEPVTKVPDKPEKYAKPKTPRKTPEKHESWPKKSDNGADHDKTYTERYLTEKKNVDPLLLMRLVEAGLLPKTGEGGFRLSDILKCYATLEDYTPVRDLIKRYVPVQDGQVGAIELSDIEHGFYKKITSKKELPQWLKNLGKKKDFFVVELGGESEFCDYLKSELGAKISREAESVPGEIAQTIS